MKYPQHTQQGFSLVETLVAITILLVILVGPLSISSSTAKGTSFASEQVVAFFLAQEGAEIAQKARDDYVLREFDGALPQGQAWSDFSDTGGTYSHCYGSDGCGLELQTNAAGSLASPVTCGSNGCKLYLDAAGGRARYTRDTSGVETPFTRTIKFTKENADEVRVESIVTWRTGSQRAVQEVRVETFLLNAYD